jgi:hypothetical protein
MESGTRSSEENENAKKFRGVQRFYLTGESGRSRVVEEMEERRKGFSTYQHYINTLGKQMTKCLSYDEPM